MPSPDPQAVLDVFNRVLDAPPEQRPALLADACGGDAELRGEVESLLAHDDSAGAAFLQPETVLSVSPAGLDSATPAEDLLLGRKISHYTIRRVIGQGGMGVVYEAEQDRPHRTVALKVLRSVFAGPTALHRFEREAELLARLHHPGIAQVFEADTAVVAGTRIPYFALELVPAARPITQYAAHVSLSLRARVDLFLRVCDAVHHGHQNGVIHRDLKPANILVGEDGAAKIIDFGVARVLDPAHSSAQTAAGQLLGTVQYMSPEQFDGDPGRVDARSDIYSLGVVLYELLTGVPPHVVGDSSIAGVSAFARRVREQPPPPPSRLNRQVRGALEAVLLKALARDPAARYDSVAALARDLHRYLAGEPTEAHPPRLTAHIVRWMTRRPLAVTALLCALVAALVLGGFLILFEVMKNRPSELVLVPMGSAHRAFIYAGAGNLLRVLKRNSYTDLPIAVRVRRAASLGGGEMVIGCDEPPGFANDGLLAVPLTAWSWRGACDQELWKGELALSDIPQRLLDRTDDSFVPERFRVCGLVLADVFPAEQDSRCAGEEIITWHQHLRTHAALRIYNARGEVLYQVWLEMVITDIHWAATRGDGARLSEPLLIVSGVYGPKTLYQLLGEPTSNHPAVVVALRPKLDLREPEYATPDAPGALRMHWMKYVNPTRGDRRSVTLFPLHLGAPATAAFGVSTDSARVDGFDSAGVGVYLDETGRRCGKHPPGTAAMDRLQLPPDHPARIWPAESYEFDDEAKPLPGAPTSRPRP